MVKTYTSIPFDEARLRRALVSSGIPQEGLESYVARAGDTEAYYTDNGVPDELPIGVFHSKYQAPDETGPLNVWDRVARAVASVEETPEAQEEWYGKFMGILKDFTFIPGGRILHGAGRNDGQTKGRKPTLSNCYVLPIPTTYAPLEELLDQGPKVQEIILEAAREDAPYRDTVLRLRALGLEDKEIKRLVQPPDSLEGIYAHMGEAARVYRSGGGAGTDLSVLRPRGTKVNSTVNKGPGVTGFMNILSESTETVAQEGRRGALMLSLRVSHPDIYDFIYRIIF